MLAPLAAWHVAAHELLLMAAIAIAIFAIDDIVIDLIYFARAGWTTIRPAVAPPSAPMREPGWMAIFVPAWDESAVIDAMLTTLLRRYDYPWYRVFVGVYPNDPPTRAAIARVDNVRVVVVGCTRDGPTTKADCLNHLWRAAVAHETMAGMRFAAIVLHDAEDVVDARELRVFDSLIPGLAMVQLPVVPLVDHASRWVSGHYLDEFAEGHGKDLVVRTALRAAVPSAGVACAIDREMLGRLAGSGDPFDATCMTEDYELGLRIAALGGRGALVRLRPDNGGIVATREHFPATLDTAIRQKTRWLLGIALSGWDRIGWQGGLIDRLMLLRDRKSLAAPLIAGLGYLAAVMAGVDSTFRTLDPSPTPALVDRASLLAALLWFNAAALGWRLGLRAGFTGSVHGWREGVRAIPRAVVANLINLAAAIRAIVRYVRIAHGRETAAWDKTAHRFPVDPAT